MCRTYQRPFLSSDLVKTKWFLAVSASGLVSFVSSIAGGGATSDLTFLVGLATVFFMLDNQPN